LAENTNYFRVYTDTSVVSCRMRVKEKEKTKQKLAIV